MRIEHVLQSVSPPLHQYQLNILHNSNIGKAIMVDVGSKPTTRRFARAIATIDIGPTAYGLVTKHQVRNIMHTSTGYPSQLKLPLQKQINCFSYVNSRQSLFFSFKISKGNVLTVAQVAGILAAKRTSELIPLCHPVQLNKVDVKCLLLERGKYDSR